MKVRAYYTRLSIPIMRRVVGPLAVLAARGKPCSYAWVQDAREMQNAGLDIALLPDWNEPGDLPPTPGVYLYDLSDALALRDPACVVHLKAADGVLVPNEPTARLVRALNAHVLVQPSLIHAEWFFTPAAAAPKQPLVVLFAHERKDWEPLVDILTTWLKKPGDLLLLTEDPALVAALPPGRAQVVSPDIITYPQLLRAVFLALFPGHEHTADAGTLHECGLFGIPCLVGPGYSDAEVGVVAGTPERWAEQLEKLTTQDRFRSQLAKDAQTIAHEFTAVRGADGWLTRLEKFARRVKH